MLLHHPDKAGAVIGTGSASAAGDDVSAQRHAVPNGRMLVGTGGKGEVDIDIVLLNEARAVLGDPTRRREWEAARRGEYHHFSLEEAPNNISACS